MSNFLVISGDAGRDFALKKVKGFSFSLPWPFGFRSSSRKLFALGETLGETASNLPSNNSPGARVVGDVSLSSFLRPKTLDKNECIVAYFRDNFIKKVPGRVLDHSQP